MSVPEKGSRYKISYLYFNHCFSAACTTLVRTGASFAVSALLFSTTCLQERLLGRTGSVCAERWGDMLRPASQDCSSTLFCFGCWKGRMVGFNLACLHVCWLNAFCFHLLQLLSTSNRLVFYVIVLYFRCLFIAAGLNSMIVILKRKKKSPYLSFFSTNTFSNFWNLEDFKVAG